MYLSTFVLVVFSILQKKNTFIRLFLKFEKYWTAALDSVESCCKYGNHSDNVETMFRYVIK